MNYPVKGATYRHTPKFLDRMKADEDMEPKPFEQEGEPEEAAEEVEKG